TVAGAPTASSRPVNRAKPVRSRGRRRGALVDVSLLLCTKSLRERGGAVRNRCEVVWRVRLRAGAGVRHHPGGVCVLNTSGCPEHLRDGNRLLPERTPLGPGLVELFPSTGQSGVRAGRGRGAA